MLHRHAGLYELAQLHQFSHSAISMHIPDRRARRSALVGGKDLLKGGYIIGLVGSHQVSHGNDLGVILVWLGLLRIKWVHLQQHSLHRRNNNLCSGRTAEGLHRGQMSSSEQHKHGLALCSTSPQADRA